MSIKSGYNPAIVRGIASGKVIDVSKVGFECSTSGHFRLDKGAFIEGKDYADGTHHRWVWSIGKCVKSHFGFTAGEIYASLESDLYSNPNFECIWLR